MATKNNQGVIILDADGSDEIKNYPTVQRNNAIRLSNALRVTYGDFIVNDNFPVTHSASYQAGRVATMTVLFKTGSFTQQPETFPEILDPDIHPKGVFYSTLTGVTNDGRPVAIIVKLTTDGKIIRLEETPLAQNATYAGNLTWITAR
jgi:hypothetical protein